MLTRSAFLFCHSILKTLKSSAKRPKRHFWERGWGLGGMRDEEQGWGWGKWLSFSQLSPQTSSPGSMASRSSWSTRWWGQSSQTPASWLPWIWPAPTVRRPRRAWRTSSWAPTVQVRHWSPPQSPPHTGPPRPRVYIITCSNSFTFPYIAADVCN